MKELIDIPDELYEAYKGRPPRTGDEGMDMIAQAIANGTPLQDGEFLLTLMQSVMTPEQLNEVLQKVVEQKNEWIPVTYRPMTEDEEKKLCEELGIKEGSLEDWEKRVFTCRLPDDGQEILTSFGKYVTEDICSWDEYGCGLENNGDWDGVDAWMPKPEPYKKGGNK